MLVPRRHRIGGIEPDGVRDGIPQPVDVRLPEDLARLPRGGVGGDRPVDQALGHRLDVELRALERPGAAEARQVDVGEQLRLGIAGDQDHRRTVGQRLIARQLPRPRRGEIVVGDWVMKALRTCWSPYRTST